MRKGVVVGTILLALAVLPLGCGSVASRSDAGPTGTGGVSAGVGGNSAAAGATGSGGGSGLGGSAGGTGGAAGSGGSSRCVVGQSMVGGCTL
jgi:hypothetical protein